MEIGCVATPRSRALLVSSSVRECALGAHQSFHAKDTTAKHEPGEHAHYGREYAERYIRETLNSPYTKTKNRILASLVQKFGFTRVLDIGSNVSGIIRREGSLRFQLEAQGITYTALDVYEGYFNPELARSLGVPEEEIHESVEYVVADVQKLPMKDGSVEAIVCADVIEHVLNPKQAFSEIARVLESGKGRAFMVIPAMYKLDLFNFRHIAEKRKSSHESKLAVSEWQTLWENAGLDVDWEASRPIGIASGLSYLAWLDDDFVPEKKEVGGEQISSKKATLHAQVKAIFAKCDEQIDAIVFSQGLDMTFAKLLSKGKVQQTLRRLCSTVLKNKISLTEEEKSVLKAFDEAINNMHFEKTRIETVQERYGGSDYSEFFMGNSILLVLKHRT